MKEILKYISRLLPDKQYLYVHHWIYHRKLLNIENPVLLNEKIQWLKLNDRTALHTLCADKLKVRDYIIDSIGEHYLIPLVGHWDNPESINTEILPDFPFIVKTNHGSGCTYILKDKKDFDRKIFLEKFKSVYHTNYYYLGREWQYKNIKPCIIIEQLLLDVDFQIPKDYKFHYFNGNLEFIQVDSNRFINHTRNFYDKEWQLLPFNWSPNINNQPKYPNGEYDKEPTNLQEMINISRILAEPFTYVRVDLYSLNGRVYFGELTFHQEGGSASFFPKEYDEKFGKKLILGS